MSEPGNTVLVVGSLHYDIMVMADHLPQMDETAVGSRWFPKFGGKGGNQAVATARQGVAARMVGAVGDDDFGTFLRRNLKQDQVDDRFVITCPGVGSGMSVAIQDAAGNYAATIVSGANLLISPDAMTDDRIWDGVGLLVMQNEIPEAVNIAAATAARQRGVMTLLNAAPARATSATFHALVDILVVNAVEAEMMGAGQVHDLPTAADAARFLGSQFATVIVTAGSIGLAAWSATDGAFTLAAEKIEAVSSHGAGDCFIGVLASELTRSAGLTAACKAASVAAAEHVAGRSGVRPAIG